jgi:hypothetical protein
MFAFGIISLKIQNRLLWDRLLPHTPSFSLARDASTEAEATTRERKRTAATHVRYRKAATRARDREAAAPAMKKALRCWRSL